MKTIPNDRIEFVESFFSLLVIFVLVTFTYGILVTVPYSGFYFNPSNGRIEIVYTGDDALLQKGDIVEQIGDISLAQFKSDRRLVMFQGAKKGEVIQVDVIREKESIR